MSILKKTKQIKDITSFSKKYFARINEIISNINFKEIKKIENEFMDLHKKNSTLFVFGNGGGAATAMTMANDLGFDIQKKTKIKRTFKIISLNDNSSVVTAIANDVGYEEIFLNQLKIHFKKNDKILIFSASGNSENLIRAAKWVRKKGGKVISILGFDGGRLKKYLIVTVILKQKKVNMGLWKICN